MSAITRVLLTAVAVIAAASCDQTPPHGASGICADAKADYICAVPFEAIYSEREALTDRSIRLDGVLVVGLRPEPPGSEVPVMLLFPSIERAKICNAQFAIELVPSSAEIAIALRSADGGFVSVAGPLHPSRKGHWGEMKIKVAPALIGGEKRKFECMTTPPPPPPEPEQGKAT